jgi:hypothetical protein
MTAKLERWTGGLLTGAAWSVLALVVIRAWTRPLLPFDCWSYHLPFAARLHGIGGETFLLAPRIREIFDGYPLAAHWLQGALWKLTGSLRAVASVNSLALVGLVGYATATLRLPAATLAFGFLALPIVAIHATSGYVDLFVGAVLAIQAVAALRCLELAGREEPPRPRALALHAGVFAAAATLAGNSKYTALGVALIVCGFVALVALAGGVRRPARLGLVALALGAALAAAATPIRNTLRHSSPVYPLSTTFVVESLAAPQTRFRKVYTRRLGPLQRPAEFALSATEIDWPIRGVEPLYNIDSNTGDRSKRYYQARTGGLWGAYILGLLALVVAAAVRRRRRRDGSRRERLWLALFGVVTVGISFAPVSYMLRYWLVWPLMLVIAAAFATAQARRPRLLLSGALAVAFLVSYFALPTHADFAPLPYHRYDPPAMRAWLVPELAAAVESGESFCLDAEHWPRQFRYAAAVVGGRHVVEQVEGERYRGECFRLPRLDVEPPAVRRPSPPP